MILKTERLTLEPLKLDDAAFYFDLFKDKDWIKFINDKNLHTVDEARDYLESFFMPLFTENGIGYFTVSITETGEKVGVSTLIKRDVFDFIDVGYGYLPKGRGKGYAFEATKKILAYAKNQLQQEKIIAFTTHNNYASKKLLKKLGFVFVENTNAFNDKPSSLFELKL